MMETGLPKLCGLSLRELLPGARIHGADDVTFTSCSADSRLCRSGDIFVAIVGAEVDGHEFVEEAVRRGATAILAERLVPAAVPVCIVPDSRLAYGELCHRLAGSPSRRMKVVGVTGTNGKTTTSCLIQSIFRVAGRRSGIMGTLGYCDGTKTAAAPLTTPGAAVLADYLARMRAGGCQHAVVELSSHALAQGRTAGLELDVACVTNIVRDHLDYHLTLQNYRAAKARILDHLCPQGVAVINLDDPLSRELLQHVHGPCLTVSLRRDAEVRATVIQRTASEQTFLLQCGDETIPVRTRIIGDHHVSNCLLATAVGLAHQIDLPTIVRGLEFVDEMPGRLQRIECGQEYSVFVDYAHTPDALAVSLNTLRETTSGRLICVFGAGGQRDRAKRPLMGAAVSALADVAFVTDDNPRGEASGAILGEILGGMSKDCEVVVEADRACAIDLALASAEPGDCVLIAGKGHERYQEIGQRRVDFDDREVVRGWFRGRQEGAALRVWRRAA